MSILQEQFKTPEAPASNHSFVSEIDEQVQIIAPGTEKLGPHAFTQSVQHDRIIYTPSPETLLWIKKLGGFRYLQAAEAAAQNVQWGVYDKINKDYSIQFFKPFDALRAR